MTYIKKYPLKIPLLNIKNHKVLPEDCEIVGQRRKGTSENDPNYIFVVRKPFLSILISYISTFDDQKKYVCRQKDFPVEALSWFPNAIEDFRKPPAECGLPAGAMISRDQNVGGEMLAVGSTTRGYNITNWSRDANGVDADPDYYEPTTLNLDHELLYDFGLLALWKELGEKYESGLL